MALGLVLQLCSQACAWAAVTVNDVTQLNPIAVDRVLVPHSVAEIQAAVRGHTGPISIGGGRFSQGGQTATEGALFIDMREFNRVLAFSAEERTITVEPGITWRAIQQHIDPADRALKIMQTYSNFTVGGSLSVNVHGRYVGQGPLVRAVRAIQLVLADGSLVVASPTENSRLFYAAIGGYGGIGVIVQATLDLADNSRIEQTERRLPIGAYRAFFFDKIRDNPQAVFHNGDIYPTDFGTVNAVTWMRTDKPVTEPARLRAEHQRYWLQPHLIELLSGLPFGNWLREKLLDPVVYTKDRVVWRNHEASYDVAELEPPSRADHTYVLQEYFVPVARFDAFVPKMAAIFKQHAVDVLNVSIRHALPDPGTLLAWAPEEVFAFVVYYRQGTAEADREAVKIWTREMIDAALSVGGRYYLPYQPQATQAQFHAAYPGAAAYFALKAEVDPTAKFRNKLVERYQPLPATEARRAIADLNHYQRGQGETYLRVPEWLIVFSSAEYADHLSSGAAPSAFPYVASIRDFWQVRKAVNVQAAPYGDAGGDQLMIWVIGLSFSVENALKGLYENTGGRVFEWIAGGAPSEEERLIARINQEYVDFIYVHPWFEFPFWQRLKDFWAEAGWQGNLLRKLERRTMFTLEFAGKAAYGGVIAWASHSVYAPEAERIYLLAEQLPADAAALSHIGGLEVVQRFADGGALLSTPRYEPFRAIVTALAAADVRYTEISGHGDILVTLIAPKDWTYDLPAGEVVFTSALVTHPAQRRLGVKLPVSALSSVLQAAGARGLRIEHTFDS